MNFENDIPSCTLPLFFLPDCFFFPCPLSLVPSICTLSEQKAFWYKIWKNRVKKMWVFTIAGSLGSLLVCMGGFETPVSLLPQALLSLNLRYWFPCMFSFSRSHKLDCSLISHHTFHDSCTHARALSKMGVLIVLQLAVSHVPMSKCRHIQAQTCLCHGGGIVHYMTWFCKVGSLSLMARCNLVTLETTNLMFTFLVFDLWLETVIITILMIFSVFRLNFN